MSATFPLRRDVFDAMDDLARTAELYKLRAEDGYLTEQMTVWLAERVLNVLATIKDASVTFGLIDTEAGTTSPMFVERDAIVAALDARAVRG